MSLNILRVNLLHNEGSFLCHPITEFAAFDSKVLDGNQQPIFRPVSVLHRLPNIFVKELNLISKQRLNPFFFFKSPNY